MTGIKAGKCAHPFRNVFIQNYHYSSIITKIRDINPLDAQPLKLSYAAYQCQGMLTQGSHCNS